MIACQTQSNLSLEAQTRALRWVLAAAKLMSAMAACQGVACPASSRSLIASSRALCSARRASRASVTCAVRRCQSMSSVLLRIRLPLCQGSRCACRTLCSLSCKAVQSRLPWWRQALRKPPFIWWVAIREGSSLRSCVCVHPCGRRLVPMPSGRRMSSENLLAGNERISRRRVNRTVTHTRFSTPPEAVGSRCRRPP